MAELETARTKNNDMNRLAKLWILASCLNPMRRIILLLEELRGSFSFILLYSLRYVWMSSQALLHCVPKKHVTLFI